MDIFQYENQKVPPNLADRRIMTSGAKSDIRSYLNAPTCRLSAIKQKSLS